MWGRLERNIETDGGRQIEERRKGKKVWSGDKRNEKLENLGEKG